MVFENNKFAEHPPFNFYECFIYIPRPCTCLFKTLYHFLVVYIVNTQHGEPNLLR